MYFRKSRSLTDSGTRQYLLPPFYLSVYPSNYLTSCNSTDSWIVADIPLPRIRKLFIFGVLELEYRPKADGTYHDFKLEADYIYVFGGRLIAGWPDHGLHFKGNVDIVLNGDASTPELDVGDGPTIGAKAMGESAIYISHPLTQYRGTSIQRIPITPIQRNLDLTDLTNPRFRVGSIHNFYLFFSSLILSQFIFKETSSSTLVNDHLTSTSNHFQIHNSSNEHDRLHPRYFQNEISPQIIPSLFC